MSHPAAILVAALASLLLASGCSDDETTAALPPSTSDGGSGGGAPTCPADATLTDDGACVFAGVAPDDCPTGFEPLDHGCTPVLPSEPCASGTMALPGETSCRPVADCGAPPWGDIPVEPGTLYVDASYQGGNSDGSDSAPFTTIQQAIDVVSQDGMIAIAEGDYVEGLLFWTGVGARLWGRCPELVTVRAPSENDSTYINRDGTELHTMALTGPSFGVLVESALGIVLDRLWIHDTADLGVLLSGANSAAEIIIVDTLIERTSAESITAVSVDVSIDRTVVREGVPGQGAGGRGIDVQSDAAWGVASATIRNTLIENVGEVGLLSHGANLDVRDSVVRDIAPTPGLGIHGVGIAAQRLGAFEGSLELHGSLIARSHLIGLSVLESSANVDNTTIVDTLPQASDGRFGDGMAVSSNALSGNVMVSRSAINGSARAGVASFSGAVQASGLSLSCNLIDLDGEDITGPFDFDNQGGNVCYCGDESRDCKVLSSGLEPPGGL